MSLTPVEEGGIDSLNDMRFTCLTVAGLGRELGFVVGVIACLQQLQFSALVAGEHLFTSALSKD